MCARSIGGVRFPPHQTGTSMTNQPISMTDQPTGWRPRSRWHGPTAQPHEKLAPTPRGSGLTVDVDRVRSMTGMEQAQAGPAVARGSGGVVPQGVELRHRRREGVRLTDAGIVLLEESRTVLSLIEHGVSRTRHAAGLGRPRLRFVVPPRLPEDLAVDVASRLQATATAADIDVAWVETPLDAEFSLVRQRRADVGLGWLTTPADALPAPVEVMSLGEFEPDVWLPADHPAVPHRVIGLAELASMDVIHGPRRLSPGPYDAWLAAMRASNPRFDFTDPPFRQSLPMTLAFAATASRPTAVLTDPQHRKIGRAH